MAMLIQAAGKKKGTLGSVPLLIVENVGLFPRGRLMPLAGIRFFSRVAGHASWWAGGGWPASRRWLMALAELAPGGGWAVGLTLSLRGQLTGHAFQIRIRCARRKASEHALQRLVGRQTTIRQAADDKQRNSE